MAKPKNFNVLSQNVKRMLLHSSLDDESFDTSTPINSPRNVKRLPSGKLKATNIPLSKNTCKLTQSGNELVDTLDTQDFTESKKHIQPENNNSGEKAQNINEKETDLHFKWNKCDEHKTSNNIKKIVQQLESRSAIKIVSSVDMDTSIKMEENSTNNTTTTTTHPNDTDSSDDHFENCINEANNFNVKVPVGWEDSKQEYLKKLSIREENKQNKSAIINELNNLPKSDQQKQQVIETTPVNGNSDKHLAILPIPEIARLKHRPLSASSICSTTSSSSSGSENLVKLGVSYLASVESLADHSENELTNSGLTLCERACMEIIDSERSYVEDLGQVIKG